MEFGKITLFVSNSLLPWEGVVPNGKPNTMSTMSF
jgi:hypothetical protein